MQSIRMTQHISNNHEGQYFQKNHIDHAKTASDDYFMEQLLALEFDQYSNVKNYSQMDQQDDRIVQKREYNNKMEQQNKPLKKERKPRTIKEFIIPHKIGYITFKQTFTKRDLNRLLTTKDRRIFEDNMWLITSQFSQDRNRLFNFMDKIQCQSLVIIRADYTQQLFRHIQHIRFENLQLLNLGYNDIFNIESLAFINAPKLKRISFKQNHIVNMNNAFAKVQFPNLHLVDMSQNEMKQFQSNRWKFANKCIDYRLCDEFNNMLCEDINFYAKYERRNVNIDIMKYLGKYNVKQSQKQIKKNNDNNKKIRNMVEKLNFRQNKSYISQQKTFCSIMNYLTLSNGNNDDDQ